MNYKRVLGSFESEIALVIKDRPKDIAGDIAGLTSVSGYDLKLGKSIRIHDTYYDTRGGDLRTRKIILRVRELGDIRLLSMKSDLTRTTDKLTRRKEVEIPWSHRSVQLVIGKLGLEPLTSKISNFSKIDSSRALAYFGLVPAQERLTKRETRRISAFGKSGTRLIAELDIDDVTYRLGRGNIRLAEIEIEAKAPRAQGRIRQIADSLESLYPDFLMKWPYGKFVTGLAIRRLLNAGLLQNLLDNRFLRPKAFQLIDQTIRSNGL